MATEQGDDGPVTDSGRVEEAAYALLIGVGSYLGIQVVALALLLPAVLLAGSLSDMEANVVAAVGTGVGAVVVAGLYLEWSRHDRSFLDLDPPDRRDVGWIVLGVAVLLGVLVAVSALVATFGEGLTDHSLADQAREGDPTVVLLLIPASLLFVGPGEELVFRNIVQKRLAESFSTWSAIGLTSVVFAAIHFQAYASGSPTQVLASLGVVFSLSVLLGWLYARTEKLVVPALVHGTYNAVQFGVLYLEVSGG